MQAAPFYQTQNEHAVPLCLVTKADYANLTAFSAAERNALVAQQFNGSYGQCVVISDEHGFPCKVIVGAFEGNRGLALASVVSRIPAGLYATHDALTLSEALLWALAQYNFDRYKENKILPRVLVVEADRLPAVLCQADAVFLVRDLINTPTNDLGPTQMAQVVESLARAHGATFSQWVGDELIRDNFPAIHAVGRAAHDAPRLLSLTWGEEAHPRVTLVGKGVCFDSGGLDIKPASGMRLMKKDMGGAAQVIGLAQWIMTSKLPIRLQVLIPAVENAIGSDAFRPGDVLTMRNGLTVEVDNTDAEGRLVLADALVKACEDNPDVLIDFATLTGAARVAVGTDISAMFTNDDALAQGISASATQMNDAVWRMPLFSDYADILNSSIADLANSSASPYAGAITAALFLQRFVKAPCVWAHFDIMAWNVGNKPGKPEGGEAMGILAVGHYLMQRFG